MTSMSHKPRHRAMIRQYERILSQLIESVHMSGETSSASSWWEDDMLHHLMLNCCRMRDQLPADYGMSTI